MLDEYKDIQGYLSVKDKILKDYIRNLGGCLSFQDCKCLNKKSLIKIHYCPFHKFGAKLKCLDFTYFSISCEEFIFPNAVVIFELSKCFAEILNNVKFCADMLFFRSCVKYFIEKNYEKNFYSQKKDDYMLEQLYSRADKYYNDNCFIFNEIAQKTSYKNLNLSKKKRYSSIKINIKNMKIKDLELLNECYEMYKSRNLKTLKAVVEYYFVKTGEKLSEMAFKKRFTKLEKAKKENLKKLRGSLSKKHKSRKETKLSHETLDELQMLRKAGFSYKKCLEYLKKVGINISKSCMYNQMKAVERRQLVEDVKFTALLGKKEERKMLKLM